MKDTEHTREQLLRELAELRQQLAQSQQLERLTRTSKEFYENIAATIHMPPVVLNADLRVVAVNRAFNNVFQITSDEAEGHLLYERGNYEQATSSGIFPNFGNC